MDLLHTFCLAIIPLSDRFKTYCYNNKIERIQKELLSQTSGATWMKTFFGINNS